MYTKKHKMSLMIWIKKKEVLLISFKLRYILFHSKQGDLKKKQKQKPKNMLENNDNKPHKEII